MIQSQISQDGMLEDFELSCSILDIQYHCTDARTENINKLNLLPGMAQNLHFSAEKPLILQFEVTKV